MRCISIEMFLLTGHRQMFERCFGLFRLEKGREQYAPHETARM